jgi:superfamily II DNA helicase RecQ
MKLLIESSNALLGSSLNLKIGEFSIEVSDVSNNEKLAITDNLGKISVEVIPSQSAFLSKASSKPTLKSVPKIEKIENVKKMENVASIEKSEKVEQAENTQPSKPVKSEVPVVAEVSKIQKVPVVPTVAEASNISSKLLFQKLAELRRDIAEELNLPPYIIFHDTTLKDMIKKLPVNLDEMMEVSGVGITKLEKYGVRFVDAIKDHIADSA